MPPDVKHAPEGTWESERGFGEGEGACIDLDMAVMLREETRKVQQLMEELFSKQANILGELHRRVSSINHDTLALSRPRSDSDGAKAGFEHLGMASQATQDFENVKIKEDPGSPSASYISQHVEPEPLPEGWLCEAAHRVAASSIFSTSIMLVIAFNLVMMGVEVDLATHLPPGEELPPGYLYVNIIIVCIFIFELAIKLTAYGLRLFFCGSEYLWNWFDVVIVVTSLVETIMDVVTKANVGNSLDSSHLRVMRAVRLARALRGVRVVKLIRSIGALRSIVLAIVSTLWSLVWTLVLLVILFYVIGVILAQLVADGCTALQASDPSRTCDIVAGEDMRYWLDVPETMLTLFLSISGGLSWVEALDPLRRISSLASFLFISYVFLSIFAILNVVTGVFCHRAIESAQADKEIAIMKQMEWKEAQLRALKGVFVEIDADKSNVITTEELEVAMSKDSLTNFLESMDISTGDLRTLFRIMDQDGSGEISFEEFISGCMTLQGPAQSIQVEDLRHQTMILRKDIQRIGSELAHLRVILLSSASKTFEDVPLPKGQHRKWI
ncbi:Probable voltage-dependent R-type calcium channel subunit alpha-1E (DOE-1) (Voltage-gated calcium channel subunit alpha Cav2.3) [Durusdinium trenchii]|uniref:Probable voltage-dependent R-type calcium channel subunit alpha-1E (DOE-1) (Voltage-gated calcium channel subunit alpha Cav2.3) n=1 Tax=Durusdinium trenchii TaxID=1381693 RepID=A0ABP0MDE9_9DINO